MQWLEQWQALSARIERLASAGSLFVTLRGAHSDLDASTVIRDSFMPELEAINAQLEQFQSSHANDLPDDARAALATYIPNGKVSVAQLRSGHLYALVPMAVFRSHFEYAVHDSEIAARSLVELAFEHLRRSIAVNAQIATYIPQLARASLAILRRRMVKDNRGLSYS
jgi:hypothetical protein